MLKSYSRVFKTLFIIGDILTVSGCWILVYYLWFQRHSIQIYEKTPFLKDHFIFLIPVIAVYSISLTLLGLYKPKRTTPIFSELGDVFKSSLISIGILVLLFYLIKEYRYSGLMLVSFWGITVSALFIFRTSLRRGIRILRSKGYNLRHILIVGTGSLARQVTRKIREHREFGLEIFGLLSSNSEDVGSTIDGVKVVGTYGETRNIVKQRGIDQVIFALSQKEHRILIVLVGMIAGTMADICVIPDLRYNFFTLRHGVEDFDGLLVIRLRESPLYGWNTIIKKCLDFSIALVVLIISSPLLVLIAVMIKIESPGPVFYKQERIGYDGTVFKMIKFRSMREDAETKSGAVWAKEDDPRRTRLGKIMRKTSIDEIPQLINVLKGEMSLVGPRPERPVFIKQFKSRIPSYMLRHKIKAGMTGWAQIHGLRGNTSLEKRIEYDLYYIENWSFWLDIKILFLTIPALFKGKGAY